MIFRNLGEIYHKTPSELMDETPDQLLIMAGRRRDLEKSGRVTISADELRAMIGHPPPEPDAPRSLVQRIRAQKKSEPAGEKVLSKRERRRQHGEAIKAARARGEKI